MLYEDEKMRFARQTDKMLAVKEVLKSVSSRRISVSTS